MQFGVIGTSFTVALFLLFVCMRTEVNLGVIPQKPSI